MGLQPITLYCSPFGPNTWKVAIVLNELSVPFELKVIANAADLKKAPFTDINPNGRAPAIEDPNTGIVLWESCAIISYLIAEYDKSHTLSYASAPEKYLQDQWLFFQASGQGPYYGQAGWFNTYHPDKIESVQKRYHDEIQRVIGVLDGALAKSKSGWLVGDKCTYVDLCFFMWDDLVELLVAPHDNDWSPEKFPSWNKWHRCMAERAAVKKVVEEKERTVKNSIL